MAVTFTSHVYFMNEITLIKFDLISHIFQTIHGHAFKSYYEVYTSNTFCTETEIFTYIPQIHSAQDRDIHNQWVTCINWGVNAKSSGLLFNSA